MGTLDPTLVRLTGSVLIAGAIVFWGIIVAAIFYWRRTGALPFKDWSGTPAKEFCDSITAHPVWWRAVNTCFATGIVLTATGLTALRSLLQRAGDTVFSDLGLASFLIGTALWVVLFTFNLSLVVWAARETAGQGEVPAGFDGWTKWLELLVITYMVFAYLSLVGYGMALLSTGLLPAWAGWVSVIVGLTGTVSVLVGGSGPAIPLLIHIVPLLIGVLLLTR